MRTFHVLAAVAIRLEDRLVQRRTLVEIKVGVVGTLGNGGLENVDGFDVVLCLNQIVGDA